MRFCFVKISHSVSVWKANKTSSIDLNRDQSFLGIFSFILAFFETLFGQNVTSVSVWRANKTSSSLDLRRDQFSSIIWSQMNGVGHAH